MARQASRIQDLETILSIMIQTGRLMGALAMMGVFANFAGLYTALAPSWHGSGAAGQAFSTAWSLGLATISAVVLQLRRDDVDLLVMGTRLACGLLVFLVGFLAWAVTG